MTRLLLPIGRFLLTALFLLGAIIGLILVWRHYEDDPWTRDGAVAADVVQVAADVSGLVTQVRVTDNQFVHAGDVLFLVDQDRYAADLAQADASVATSEANIENAKAGIVSAQAALNNAQRERERYVSLGNLVSKEERDQRVTAAEQDEAALAQSKAQADQATAGLRQALANRRLAEINLQRSSVRAGVNGYVTGFSLRPGDYVNTGSAVFALLDSDSYYILGYFEETKLHRFQLGDKVRVLLLGESRPIWGHVDSMSAGVTDRQQNSSGVLLPNITPTFSWIRLAQRVPVRVVIDQVPPGMRVIAGRTATVTILPTLARVPAVAAPQTALPATTTPIDRPPRPPIGLPGIGATQSPGTGAMQSPRTGAAPQ